MLDDLFKCDERWVDYHGFSLIKKPYSILLWVGSIGVENKRNLSAPNIKDLSLDEYTHFSFIINKHYLAISSPEMYELFGFDLMEFPTSRDLMRQPNYGYMVPKSYLIKILQKLGIINPIPDDAGDGE